MDIYQIIREPHITEKANSQKEGHNQISFKVNKHANKIEIKKAIETIFKIKVLEVKTQNVDGKKKRVGKNIGKKSDWKKAIVKLPAGERIEGLDGI